MTSSLPSRLTAALRLPESVDADVLGWSEASVAGARAERARTQAIDAALVDMSREVQTIASSIMRPLSLHDAEMMLFKIEGRCNKALAALESALNSEGK